MFKDNPDGTPPRGGFRRPNSRGSLAWIHQNTCYGTNPPPGDGINENTEKDWKQIFGAGAPQDGGDCSGIAHSDTGLQNFLDSFYNIAKCTYDSSTPNCPQPPNSILGELAFAGVYKGFDNVLAFPSQPPPRKSMMAQKCGQAWIDSWNEFNTSPSFFFPQSNQINAIQVITWNDYDEGTEIESGIDNCFPDNFTASLGSNAMTLTWNPQPSDPEFGNEQKTVDHYEVYDSDATQSADLRDLLWMVDVPVRSDPNTPYIFDFTGKIGPGPRLLYVKQIGKPSILNHMSVGVCFPTPNSCGTFARLSASSLTWTSQQVSTTSPSQTVTLSNTGRAPLSISSISATGNYRATTNCPSLLNVHASCNIGVSFTPTASGTRTGILVIRDNAMNSPQTVFLTGKGR